MALIVTLFPNVVVVVLALIGQKQKDGCVEDNEYACRIFNHVNFFNAFFLFLFQALAVMREMSACVFMKYYKGNQWNG